MPAKKMLWKNTSPRGAPLLPRPFYKRGISIKYFGKANQVATDEFGFILSKKLSSRRVKQGAVGDCSFLAVLNCLVDYDAEFNVSLHRNTNIHSLLQSPTMNVNRTRMRQRF